MDYVNKESFAEYLDNEIRALSSTTILQNPLRYGRKEAYGGVKKRLMGYPSAKVSEIKYGMWFDTGSFDAHYTPIYQCSACRKEVADNYIELHKYCLHCGAKMSDGEKR